MSGGIEGHAARAAELAREGSGQRVTATTFVRTRNRLGRLYLAAVKPFHHVIVPAMLAQVGKVR